MSIFSGAQLGHKTRPLFI